MTHPMRDAITREPTLPSTWQRFRSHVPADVRAAVLVLLSAFSLCAWHWPQESTAVASLALLGWAIWRVVTFLRRPK